MTKVSPSQLDAHLTCPRKRWFSSFLKLPDKTDHGRRDLGTAFHACAERWLSADDQGRVPSPVPKPLQGQEPGSPVDPFPSGWESGEERGRRWTLSWKESVVVRRLVNEAISSGVLRRLPGREVEVWRESTLVQPCEEFPRGITTRMKIDQRNVQVVEDHKTTGSKKHAMGEERLSRDPKMLCYAVQHFADHPEAELVVLRLNYAWTGRGDVAPWPVEVQVTREEAARFRDEVLVPAAKEMARNERFSEAQWRQVEGPREEGACEKFGGCPYARVCSGLSTIADLSKHPVGRTVDLSRFEAVALTRQPKMTNEDKKTPPWHVAGCRACLKTPGIDGKGRPCKACDVVSGRTGGRTSSEFKVWLSERGELLWAEPDGKAPVEPPRADPTAGLQEPAPPPAAMPADPEVRMQRALSPLKPLKKAVKKVADQVARELEQQKPVSTPDMRVEEPKPEPEAPPRQPDQTAIQHEADADQARHAPVVEDNRKPTLILLLGATCRSARELTDVLRELGEQMARDGGVDSFWDLDPFRRRDQFAKHAASIVASLASADGKGAVLQCGGERSPDLDALVVALLPHATLVVRGSSR